MRVRRVLETCLYATDLEATARFYVEVLGLEELGRQPGRHVFLRCGEGMLLLFDPQRSRADSEVCGARVPGHAAVGPAHVAFAVPDPELDRWRARLEAYGVPIESEVRWPGGGRSLYLRDPAGHCVELASPRIWGLPDA